MEAYIYKYNTEHELLGLDLLNISREFTSIYPREVFLNIYIMLEVSLVKSGSQDIAKRNVECGDL